MIDWACDRYLFQQLYQRKRGWIGLNGFPPVGGTLLTAKLSARIVLCSYLFASLGVGNIASLGESVDGAIVGFGKMDFNNLLNGRLSKEILSSSQKRRVHTQGIDSYLIIQAPEPPTASKHPKPPPPRLLNNHHHRRRTLHLHRIRHLHQIHPLHHTLPPPPSTRARARPSTRASRNATTTRSLAAVSRGAGREVGAGRIRSIHPPRTGIAHIRRIIRHIHRIAIRTSIRIFIPSRWFATLLFGALYRFPIPFLVSGWSTLTEDLRRGSNWLSGGSSNSWQTSADLSPPLRRSSVSVDHPLTRKGIVPFQFHLQDVLLVSALMELWAEMCGADRGSVAECRRSSWDSIALLAPKTRLRELVALRFIRLISSIIVYIVCVIRVSIRSTSMCIRSRVRRRAFGRFCSSTRRRWRVLFLRFCRRGR